VKVNAVAYIFPTERICHRLRADSGFRYMSKFGTGVAIKIRARQMPACKRMAGSVPL